MDLPFCNNEKITIPQKFGWKQGKLGYCSLYAIATPQFSQLHRQKYSQHLTEMKLKVHPLFEKHYMNDRMQWIFCQNSHSTYSCSATFFYTWYIPDSNRTLLFLLLRGDVSNQADINCCGVRRTLRCRYMWITQMWYFLTFRAFLNRYMGKPLFLLTKNTMHIVTIQVKYRQLMTNHIPRWEEPYGSKFMDKSVNSGSASREPRTMLARGNKWFLLYNSAYKTK